MAAPYATHFVRPIVRSPTLTMLTFAKVRGSARVTSPDPEGSYQALEKYGQDLTARAQGFQLRLELSIAAIAALCCGASVLAGMEAEADFRAMTIPWLRSPRISHPFLPPR